MKINCLSCGFKVDLDDTYDDFEGPIKCLCGALLEIRTEEGMLKGIKLAEPRPCPSQAQADGRRGHSLRSVQAGSGLGNFSKAGLSWNRGGYPRFPVEVRERYGGARSSEKRQILIRHSDRSRGADL